VTQDVHFAVEAQSLVAVQQRPQAESGLTKENRDVAVTLRAFFGWWPVVTRVSEGMQVPVPQYWATCPAMDQRQVLAPLEWFPVFL